MTLGSLNSSHLELVANKISQLLRNDENEKSDDSSNKSSHERKGSYKVAVNNSSTSMKSPIERRIKLKNNITKEDLERGYRSDVEFYSKDKNSFDITGYSSDCELTSKRLDRLKRVVPKEFDSDSVLIQMPYESNRKNGSDFDSQKPIKRCELNDISTEKYQMNSETEEKSRSITNSRFKQSFDENSNKREKTTPPLDLSSDKTVFGNPIDMNSNSSIGSLYPSSGSEKGVSLCSGRRSHSIETSNGSANPSANTSQCSLSRNESTITETNQFKAPPTEQEVGVPVVTSSRLKQPQTASSQFIFHKFSHDFYTQTKPLIGQNSTSHTVFGPEDINSKNTTNGINLIQDSSQTNCSNASNHSLNNVNIVSNRLLSNSSAHVVSISLLN